jgi:Primase X
LQTTLKKIGDCIDGCPTVLDTGKGFHIYQPICGVVLDEINELNDRLSFDKYYLSNKFLKFAEQYFTDGNSDPQHNPTVNSCLMRVPGTINSKCLKVVSIAQEWDYIRPTIESLLPAFRKYLSGRGEMYKQDLDHPTIYPKYLHRINQNFSNQIRYIWIDTLMQIPLGDYRKYVMRLIIAPYLIVVKQKPYGECVKIMMDWLNRCNCVERLRFSAEFTVSRFLLNAQRVGYRPIRLEKLQQEIPALYDIVMRKLQSGSRNF